MENITVSSKGKIVISMAIRDTLNLAAGTKLTLDVRGREIILSPDPAWRKLRGAAAGTDLMAAFAAHRKAEREDEDSRP